jgi:hypothetical protein
MDNFQVQHGIFDAYQVSLQSRSFIHNSVSFQEIKNPNLLGGLGSLAGLGAAELLGGSILLGELGAANSADASDGLLADISTVTVLGGLVGNTLVDPIGIGYQYW